MKELFLYIWQLPQNIIGLIIIIFGGAKYKNGYWIIYSRNEKLFFGVSLGDYIIFCDKLEPIEIDLKHEQGHQKQSLCLGWLYLFVIGLPSFFGNIYDRIFHKDWDDIQRYYWYYNQPWEKWADENSEIIR